MHRVRNRLWNAVGIWVIGAVVSVWIILLPRMVPVSIDHGIFISVSERLLAGDRLYAEVWDNKDPLIFYGLAIGRYLTPYASLIIEVGLVLTCSIALVSIARRLGQSVAAQVLGGLVMAPIILTGTGYVAGYTHLPGTALSLAILALSLSRRFTAAGVLLALLAFTKLVILPFGAVFLVVAAVGTRSERRPYLTAAAAAGVTAGVIVGVMALRGELPGYLATQVANVVYSQGPVTSIVGHLRAVIGAGELTLLLAATLVGVVHWSRIRLMACPERTLHLTVLAAALASMVLALASTAMIGLWGHHAQVFLVPGTLAGVLVCSMLDNVMPVRGAAAMVTAVLASALLAGVPAVGLETYVRSLTGVRYSVGALAAVSSQAMAVTDLASSGSYARIGPGEGVPGHAAGLANWELACRRFHQYWFQGKEAFGEVVECLPTADVLIVEALEPYHYELAAAWPAWGDFLDQTEEILATDFDCATTNWGRLCIRR